MDTPTPSATYLFTISKLFKIITTFRERSLSENFFAPQVFRIATQWVEANYRCDKFFMTVDSFDPHEPWDPPQYYRDLYYPGYRGKEVIMPIFIRMMPQATSPIMN